MIDRENKTTPVGSGDSGVFLEKGMIIARRTIGKYRQALRILPSHLRKNNRTFSFGDLLRCNLRCSLNVLNSTPRPSLRGPSSESPGINKFGACNRPGRTMSSSADNLHERMMTSFPYRVGWTAPWMCDAGLDDCRRPDSSVTIIIFRGMVRCQTVSRRPQRV